ncbi:MAG: 1-(5-phosphoribosyl)-5-[(5-phosphoribosylamino)methylideneamino]imidazole-4-carboxamide isomerase [bacterium]
MRLYPAIDLLDSQPVRLKQGDFKQQTRYKFSTLELAKRYESEGAHWLHLVDLDGAKAGKPVNLETLQSLKKQTELKIQIGGGVRTTNDIESLIQAGADRIIIGSLAVKEPEQMLEWLNTFGSQRFCLGLDIRLDENNTPMLSTNAWRDQSTLSLWDLLDQYTGKAEHVLCTDIGRDGLLSGPNFSLYKSFASKAAGFSVQASGGISRLSDLENLVKCGVAGAITGKSLLENKFTVQEALCLPDVS